MKNKQPIIREMRELEIVEQMTDWAKSKGFQSKETKIFLSFYESKMVGIYTLHMYLSERYGSYWVKMRMIRGDAYLPLFEVRLHGLQRVSDVLDTLVSPWLIEEKEEQF